MSQMYYYALKEDYIEAIKQYEKKVGGLKYVLYGHQYSLEPVVYNSIEEIPGIGTRWYGYKEGLGEGGRMYGIFFKDNDISMRKIDLYNGETKYCLANLQDCVLFYNEGGIDLVEKDVVRKSYITDVYPKKHAKKLFAGLKRAFLKNMQQLFKGQSVYIGNSLIKNKGKYIITDYRKDAVEYHIDISHLEVK
ncbi:hypothetical protein [Oceanivirga salmonicida]|uniref:hypothetical protein n=1 Tax=Oceanivirga salmonicida TaxID=1769291 RepID=UPI000833B290|nr:hypothetical protein [Oceanivirga salmonicida]